MFDSKALTAKLTKVVEENQATKDVEAFGMKLKLRLLGSDEDMEVYDGLEGIEGVNYLMSLKKDVIARSIFMIDGQKLPDEIEGPDGKLMQRRLYLKSTLLKDVPQLTLDALHSAYLVMNVEFKMKIDGLIKFDNADLINKFLEDEAAAKATADAVDKLVEQEVAEAQAETEPAPTPAPQQAQAPAKPIPVAQQPQPQPRAVPQQASQKPAPPKDAKMTSFARPGPKA